MNVLSTSGLPESFSQTLRFPRRLPLLRSMPVSAGVETRTEPTYDWNGLARGPSEFALFQYTLEGAGELTYEGRSFSALPGQAMLLHVPHEHRYRVPPGGHWKYFYICLNGSETLRHWRRIEKEAGPLLELSWESATIDAATGLCRAFREGTLQTAWQASAMAYKLIMALAAESEDLQREKARSTLSGAAERRLQSARQFAERSFSRPVGVAEMVRASGFSRSHFSRLFHYRFGMSPLDYLNGLRLREAMRLLADTPAPVTEIALRSGFTDPNYFSRVFRKACGMSPRAYRQNGFTGGRRATAAGSS